MEQKLLKSSVKSRIEVMEEQCEKWNRSYGRAV